MSQWTLANLKDQTGKRILITGASSGIGMHAANQLAAKGATVYAAVRNVEKARSVLRPEIEVHHLDLADLGNVYRFVTKFNHEIDVLLNNAGVMATPLKRTPQGFELQMGTNHFGHFALTGRLLHQIKDRVVTVSSTAHRMGKINLDDINWNKSYSRWPAYGQSKLANLLFTTELDDRFRASGSSRRAIAVHPGYSDTNLQGNTQNEMQDKAMKWMNKVLAQSALQGAEPSLFAITEDVPGNSFIGPDGFMGAKGHPTYSARSKEAEDREMAKALWQLSEELTGVRYEF